ncbi:hypothetical protein [Dactylosporangium sp. CS-033363]|uniref:hypothetical protein n=1 Tax=Dactylosporangium sp. CS-033363 TaxID=3239935 RepID=UPI003D8F9239
MDVTEIQTAALLGVHGIGQHHLGRHQLLATWRPALSDGLERAAQRRLSISQFDMAFYGDVYLTAEPGTAEKSADDEAVLDGADEAELAELRDAMADVVSDEDVAAAENEVSKAYTRVPRPLQVLLRAIDRRFGAAAGVLYLGVLRQVRRYLVKADVKERIDARVRESVSDECQMLVAHSLGSVVAYEYLRQNTEHRVKTLLTVGSPLGLRMVRSRLSVAPLAVPVWSNIRDRRDPVACAGDLRSWWPQIKEDLPVDNGGNSHSVERYLSRKATGEVVLRALPFMAAG